MELEPIGRTFQIFLASKPAFLPALLAATAAFCLYAITLKGTYVYDDIVIVLQDPRVHSVNQWSSLWTRDYFNGGVDNLYRPLVSSSYALEWFVHGNRPWLFHAVNILLHALCAAGVAEFTRRALQLTSFGWNASVISGLLFALHPVHVEAVANIVGRAELACTAAIFWALVTLCKRRLTFHRAVGVIALGIVALFCKEQGILLPFVWFMFTLCIWNALPLQAAKQNIANGMPVPAQPVLPQNTAIDYARIALPTAAGQERQVIKISALVVCWTWAIYLIVREHFLKFDWDRGFLQAAIQPMVNSHGTNRVLMPVVVLGHYARLLFWPSHLSPAYDADVIGSIARLKDPYLWIGIATILTWIMATVWTWCTFRRFLLFNLVCLAATYLLIGNVFSLLNTLLAERLVYLPSAFFLIIISMYIAQLPVKPRVILMTVLMSLASYRTITTARDWNEPVVLFQNALAAQPKSLQLRFLLAQEYHSQNNDLKADEILCNACDTYPTYWQTWMRRAEQALNEGKLADAERYLARAKKIEANPQLLGLQDRLQKMKTAGTIHR